MEIKSISGAETERLGEAVGRNLRGGEVIFLVSDVGGGKTTLVKGISRGLGYDGVVSSPTLMVSRVYKGRDLTLHHYDFYRLNEAGLMTEELKDVMDDQKNVVVIEWGSLVESAVSRESTVISIDKHVSSEDLRIIKIAPSSSSVQLFQNAMKEIS